MKGTNWRRAFEKSGKGTKVKLITKIPKWWVEGTKKELKTVQTIQKDEKNPKTVDITFD